MVINSTKLKIQIRKKLKNPRIRRIRKGIASPVFAKYYAAVALLLLLTTTALWSLLGANLQQDNSDQLVNSYLFEKPSTFHDALLPGSHSFLIKWPVFMLIKALGFSSHSFIALTIVTVLITVILFALLIYRIERRPLVFGTIYLALASVLLLIPAHPYAGALLPVNMAMLATRNLEYVLYIAGLILLVQTPRVRSWKFCLAIILLALLIASDKLFLTLSIGGALLALTAYGLSSGWNMVSLSARWLLGGVLGAAGAIITLWWLNLESVTHIGSQAGVGPYGLIQNGRELALGAIYGVLGLFTSFGANPAFQTTIIKDVPRQTLSHLLSFSGPAYLINIAILCLGIFSAYRIIGFSLAHNRDGKLYFDNSSRLSIAMIWTSLAAFLVFISSNHYFAADARYLTIAFFGLFIAGAVYLRQIILRPEKMVVAGLVLLIGILFGVSGLVNSYHEDKKALQPTHQRNLMVTEALRHHPVKVLVGDYWRVIPTKFASGSKLNVMPLSACLQARDILSSKNWQHDLTKNSFAYLLTLDGSQTDYPQCTLDEVINAYGRPNASIIIAGSQASPKEILLFYDRGAHMSAPSALLKTPSTVLPVGLDELPYLNCKVPTVMNIVAHEDDDLLFMSPDLLDNINAGYCVRTIYVTAGDAGSGYYYWLSREHGSQAAYSKMLNFSDVWVERIVKIADNQYITVANPRGNSKISLIFMHLPDGNLKGQGFGANNFESLAKLNSGRITTIKAVYGGSSYTSNSLIDGLASLMQAYSPIEIHTQSISSPNSLSDHSDHNNVGSFVQRAHNIYEAQRFAGKVDIPIKYYLGYPVYQMPVNLAGDQLINKEEAFFAYSKYDGVCYSPEQCLRDPAYGTYLPRQYQSP
jgi:hypothetical protein